MVSQFSLLERVYIFTALVTAAESLVLSIFVFLRNRERRLNRSYALFGCCVGLWSLCLFFCHLFSRMEDALLLNRLVHFFSVLIAISFYNFIHALLQIKGRRALHFGIAAAVVIGGLCFTPFIIQGMSPKYSFRLWPVPGLLYHIYFTFFSFYSYYSLFLVFRHFCKETGVRKEQLRCIFIALSVGFIGGSSNFAYFFNIPIPPVGNFFVFLYVLILAYAIIRYQLMDIRIIAASTIIFIAVYTVTLGVPFYFYKMGFHLYALILMGVLATIGPSIYLYLQRRANATLLVEQRRYQSTLIQASSGMGRIKELKMLLKLIVRIVTRAVRVEHSAVYVFDQVRNAYVLGAHLSSVKGDAFLDEVPVASVLVKHLIEVERPVLIEEVRQHIAEKPDAMMSSLVVEMGGVKGVLVIPSSIENRLVGFLVLGNKMSGKLFTQDDLSVFTILANQSALAIENAQFYADMQQTQEQLFKAEKMATIGIMADGLSHQINNRLHAMGFIAGDMLDTMEMNKDQFAASSLQGVFDEFKKGFGRLEENVIHGRNIVQGLMKYTRKGEEGFGPCDPASVLKSAREMLQFKIKEDRIHIVAEFPEDLRLKGNFTQLQEVFFNLIDNAYDAMMQRQDELAEEGYEPTLKISVEVRDEKAVMIFVDNGIGVKEDDMTKLFTPFFTTKLSSRKGTGLGLYVIRKIVEENHGGRIEMTSKYHQGTQFSITLPMAVKGEF